MSENIKVSEVSDILRKQLEGINTHVQLDEIGTVLQVSDGVVRIYGLRNAEANELLEFDNGIKAIVMNLEEDNVGAVLLGPTDRIKEGFIVKRTKHIASIRVGEGMLGRVIDPLGEPLDGKGWKVDSYSTGNCFPPRKERRRAVSYRRHSRIWHSTACKQCLQRISN